MLAPGGIIDFASVTIDRVSIGLFEPPGLRFGFGRGFDQFGRS
jgi:hypothetical protein